MHRIAAVFVLTSAAVCGQSKAKGAAITATVRVMISDGWGNQVPEATVEIKPLGGWRSPQWINYPKDSIIAIMPGEYVISVDAKGFRKYANIYNFSSGRHFLPLGLVLAEIEHSEVDLQPVLRGRVGKSLRTAQPSWIRIVAISAGEVRNVEIDETGLFSVPDLLPGRYMLFVMSGGILEYSQIVEVRGASTEIGIDAPVVVAPK